MHFDAGGEDDIDLRIQPFAWQAIIRDAVAQHTAQPFAFFVYDALMAHQLQIICSAQSAGTAADDGDTFAGGRCTGLCRHMTGMIDRITLDAADVDRIVQHVAPTAGLTRMLTDEGTYRREWVVLADQTYRIGIPAFFDKSDIAGNVHTGRAHGYTGNRLVQAGGAASVQDVFFIVITEAADTFQDHFRCFIADGTVRAPGDVLRGLLDQIDR